MAVKKRQQLILDRLEQKGACSYRELADLLGVSTMTVRRDVDGLTSGGVAIKTLGGVQRANAPSYLYETPLLSRFAEHPQAKRAIAGGAMAMIAPEQTIFLDGGTTCLELARLIAEREGGLTIVTNSALGCLELGRNSDNTVVGISGVYDPGSVCFVGPTCEELAGKLFVDLAFVSTKGFVPAEGTFESSVATFRIKQIIARQCSRVVLLADHSKFGRRALSKVLDISQIHTVITDEKASLSDVTLLEDIGKEVRVARAGDLQLGGAAHVS